MVRGVVKWFNLEKGFGFIEITTGKDAGSDIFVHASDIQGNPLRDEDQVEFEIDEDDRAGKPRACKVTGGTARPEDRAGGKGKGKGGGKPGDWDCDRCQILNFASRVACFKCGAEKPRGAGRDYGRDNFRGGGDRGRRDSRDRGRDRDRRDSRDRGKGDRGGDRDRSRGRSDRR